MEKKQIKFNSSDIDGMKELMEKYWDSEMPFSGTNEDGEDALISIFCDKIVAVTYQENGWLRKNIYYKDNTREEIFDGKWR